jgi:hypothetical protein
MSGYPPVPPADQYGYSFNPSDDEDGEKDKGKGKGKQPANDDASSSNTTSTSTSDTSNAAALARRRAMSASAACLKVHLHHTTPAYGRNPSLPKWEKIRFGKTVRVLSTSRVLPIRQIFAGPLRRLEWDRILWVKTGAMNVPSQQFARRTQTSTLILLSWEAGQREAFRGI